MSGLCGRSYIIGEKYDAPLPERAAHRIVKDVSKIAFPRGRSGFVGPYAFRHWHGQRLRLMSVPIDQIQATLGHSSPAATEQNYAPLTSRKVIEQIEGRL
jgi:integrase